MSNSPAGATELARPAASLRPSLGTIARNWWPVAVWLGILRIESTDAASSRNTFQLLYRIFRMLSIPASVGFVAELDHLLRKSGHFIGYGILGSLTFLAMKHMYRDRLRPLLSRTWGSEVRDLWQLEWAIVGMLVTIVTAAADEIHQSFIASRTGRWQDVVLDASGAAVLQIFFYVWAAWSYQSTKQQDIVEEPTLSR